MPIVFRCYQCNQVLKTSRSKAGSVVACPKCKAELLVPEPPAQEPAVPEPAPSESGDESDASAVIRSIVSPQTEPPADFPDIRPEDIRVELREEPLVPRKQAERPSRHSAPPFEVKIEQEPAVTSEIAASGPEA